MSDTTRYSFESKPTRRTLEQAGKMLDKLLRRLGVGAVDLEKLASEDKRTLVAFTTACHLNIEWYDRSRRRHKRMYWGFVVFTVLVVVGMPVAIALTNEASEALTAQIGVIITGVLAAHRLLASTFEKRNLAHHFWKAQADLKSVLYSFEDEWRNEVHVLAKPSGDKAQDAHVVFDPKFMAAVEEATQKALQIKSEEQEAFFARAESSFSALSEILGLGFKQGSAMVETSRQDARAKGTLRAEVKELEAVKTTIERQLADLEAELQALEGSTSTVDEGRRRGLLATYDSQRKKLLDKEIELTEARSKLSRL